VLTDSAYESVRPAFSAMAEAASVN